MNRPVKSSCLAALITGLFLILSSRVTAQTITTLHSFSGPSMTTADATNSDGAIVGDGLIISGNTLYGMTTMGGLYGGGTAFAINADGSGFKTLRSFSSSTNDVSGAFGGWMLSGQTLYGTGGGGANGLGAVFALNTDGTGFRIVHSFALMGNLSYKTNSEGGNPVGGVISSGKTLYGTASALGAYNYGTVFAVNTDGTGFATLHAFTAPSASFQPGGIAETNRDGAEPFSRLVLSGNTLYGTTKRGGSYGNGTVFSVNTDGSGFTNLYNFRSSNPGAALVLSGNTLYGLANEVFALNTNGAGFTNLQSLNGLEGNEYDGLTLSGNTLYGPTWIGGTNMYGSVFAVNTNGAGFTTLYAFTAGVLNTNNNTYTNCEGFKPNAPPILSGNTLYGTTFQGGANGNGTVYSLSFPAPQLGVNCSGNNLNLTWSSAVAGFYGGLTLQSATNLLPPVAWTPVSQAPVTVNGQNFLTNSITGPQQFFRLSQ
jgi:uncharacterized repeat protein (TIGR03803 family)